MKYLIIFFFFFIFYNIQNINAQNTEKLKSIVLDDYKSSEYYSKQLKALNKITNQEDLFDIVKKSDNSNFRKFAVKKITDTLILQKIAILDKEGTFFLYDIIENIKDQKVLKAIVTDDSYDDVNRVSAIRSFNNQDILKKIALDRNNSNYLRGSAIKKLKNQKLLYSLIKYKENKDLKYIALGKLTNQNYLEDIAKNEQDFKIREKAIVKLTNDTLLQKIAETDSYYLANSAKFRLILNDSFIKNRYGLLNIELYEHKNVTNYEMGGKVTTHDLAISIFDSTNRTKIFNKTYECYAPDRIPLGGGGNRYAKIDYIEFCKHFLNFNYETLKIFIQKTHNKYLMKSALEIISQYEIIDKIVQNNNLDIKNSILIFNKLDIERRIFTCSKINNQELLYRIALEDKNNKVRLTSLCQLIDQNKIANLIIKSSDNDLRYKASEILNNQTAISKVLMTKWTKDYYSAKINLIKKTKNKEVLGFILLNDKNILIRREVLKFVTNQKNIAKIATTPFSLTSLKKQDEFEYNQLRWDAIQKLTDKKALKQIKKDENKFLRQNAKDRLKRL